MRKPLKVGLANMMSVYIGLQKLEQSHYTLSYSCNIILEAALLNFTEWPALGQQLFIQFPRITEAIFMYTMFQTIFCI